MIGYISRNSQAPSVITMDLLYFRVTPEALPSDEWYNEDTTKAVCFYRDILTSDGKLKDLSGHSNHGTMSNVVVKKVSTVYNIMDIK